MGAIFRGRKCYTGKVKFTDYQNIGKIDAFMRTTAPEGYLACDGSTYNIADYPLLCDVFASDFGSVNYFGGNGTTTFAVPDLRGEFLRGTGTNSHSGQGSGSNVGVHQDATNIPTLKSYKNAGGQVGNVQAFVKNDNTTTQPSNRDSTSTNVGTVVYADLAKVGTQTDAETYTARPTNTSVLYCIRAY